MTDKQNNKRNKKNMQAPKKGMKTPAVPVPPAASELSAEDLKRVTGGSFQWGVGSSPEFKID